MQKPRTNRRFTKFYADLPLFRRKNCVQIMISRFFTHRRPYFHMQFCTNRAFSISCRRFWAVFARNSARFSIFQFFAEDFAEFSGGFLHENGFCVFVQKKHTRAEEKFCINCGFYISCRNAPSFGRKNSARNQFFKICAETRPLLGEKSPHELRFCVFVRKSVYISVKTGLAGAVFLSIRACGAAIHLFIFLHFHFYQSACGGPPL